MKVGGERLIVARARALAAKPSPFHIFPCGLPPFIVCSATARTNIFQSSERDTSRHPGPAPRLLRNAVFTCVQRCSMISHQETIGVNITGILTSLMRKFLEERGGAWLILLGTTITNEENSPRKRVAYTELQGAQI